MKFFKENRTLVLGGVLAILGVYAYFNFFGGGGGGAEVTSATNSSPVSQELLLTLTTLNVIKLDAGIFDDAVFLSLSDFGVQIPQEVVGRRNPFAPIGAN